MSSMRVSKRIIPPSDFGSVPSSRARRNARAGTHAGTLRKGNASNARRDLARRSVGEQRLKGALLDNQHVFIALLNDLATSHKLLTHSYSM